MNAPRFAVVGRVNKGKSSIVAALTENDGIAIARDAGTTTACQEVDLHLGDETLFTLIDTPGFQDAPAVLDWLRARDDDPSRRADQVRAFIAAHRTDPDFVDEVRLLEPILDPAHFTGIIYVVDGSHPYRPNYRAEMEILRFCGRPRMALINHIGDNDHSADWQAVLDQYFNTSQVFDAHDAPYQARRRVLSAFRTLAPDEALRARLDTALQLLDRAWDQRLDDAAHLIVDALAAALPCTVEVPIGRQPLNEDALRDQLRARLRQVENDHRRLIETLYRHHRLQRADDAIDTRLGDLFAAETWRLLGLPESELALYGGIGGALAGGGIDLALGGSSLLLGSLIGAAAGALSPWLARRRLARVRLLGQSLAERRARIGPVNDPNFPWVLLDRALLHHQAISQRSHARRDILTLPSDERSGPSSQLMATTKRQLGRCFPRLDEPEAQAQAVRLIRALLNPAPRDPS